jgi:hypothetical protein
MIWIVVTPTPTVTPLARIPCPVDVEDESSNQIEFEERNTENSHEIFNCPPNEDEQFSGSEREEQPEPAGS